MREFTEADVQDGRISADAADLIDAQPQWMRRGLQETASGYGARLNSGRKIRYCGRAYRIYVTCFSNNGTCWFTARGKRIVVS